MPAIAEILVERSPGETRVALVDEAGRLVDLLVERSWRPSRLGEVVLARVRAVRPEHGGAFLDIGGAEAYLSLDGPKALREGEALVVTVAGDAAAGKPERLNRGIVLEGRYLVLSPGRRGVGVSSRIAEAGERRRLQAAVKQAASEAQPGTGVVVRSVAAGAAADALSADLAVLAARIREIRAAADHAKAPATLWAPPGVLAQARLIAPGVPVVEDRDGTLIEARGLEEQADAALSPSVRLSGGAVLTFETTRALTTIDVDSASAGSDHRGLDLTAADGIARQIRLRGIAGLIVIDFPRLRHQDDRTAVTERLRRAFADDPNGAVVHGWTRAGLMEITRRRTRPSLAESMLDRPAARRSAEAVAAAALRRLSHEGRRFVMPRLLTAPEVAEVLTGAAGAPLDAVNQRLGGGVTVQGVQGYEREQVDIVEGRHG